MWLMYFCCTLFVTARDHDRMGKLLVSTVSASGVFCLRLDLVLDLFPLIYCHLPSCLCYSYSMHVFILCCLFVCYFLNELFCGHGKNR